MQVQEKWQRIKGCNNKEATRIKSNVSSGCADLYSTYFGRHFKVIPFLTGCNNQGALSLECHPKQVKWRSYQSQKKKLFEKNNLGPLIHHTQSHMPVQHTMAMQSFFDTPYWPSPKLTPLASEGGCKYISDLGQILFSNINSTFFPAFHLFATTVPIDWNEQCLGQHKIYGNIGWLRDHISQCFFQLEPSKVEGRGVKPSEDRKNTNHNLKFTPKVFPM